MSNKHKEIISEDITVFNKMFHKLETILSLSINGKFIVSHEKIKGLRDMSKYFLGKRIQEMDLLEDESGMADEDN
ncbi:hypothetical protein CMI47_04725 [Candidatus Pacearchaeota archaeon]|jgi:hypothetical protein|nr:hypothetical protein [Candidatus Pacearchaeota archaeon]|tara:strand:+ start:9194 stop:9418 length:225 start_codon:yes stop_codon:yes gene_type:complete